MSDGIRDEKGRFLPGICPNPTGQGRAPADLVEARKLNRVEFERTLNRYIHMPLDEIKTAVMAPDAPALEVLVAKIISVAITKGDEKRLGFILDRLGIVVKQKLSIDGGEDADGNSKPLQLQRVDLLDRLKQLRSENGEA